jgi:glucose/arabinose dehydrogenase
MRHIAVTLFAILLPLAASAADNVIPHAQDKPPGPPLTPAEAMAKMKVPEGFQVELVASEPDLVNPVAFTFDEKGRIWVAESLEYPRKQPGAGKDRIKVLEDTDGDGKADKFTIFAEGLNIPSGIAVGHGGVWVANSPDILFYPDADRDAKPDGEPQVIVTGFGRDDTHELPNSFTWGPDGWLYGLNGVFNNSRVKYGEKNPNFASEHRGWDFTCALWRIHPQTREFQVFCEGTSNPWGVAIDGEGSFFVSACVIDHLWHLVETGYYHRQGGPYPPFTWKIDSIVTYKHQKAAYCGIHWFDSDAYPEQYRGKLFMGNIHGNCINVDSIKRDGSTYAGSSEPDFLSADDAWFMPVGQETGPDGSLYVLDWYDRYHCYQDANRDPNGIDRLKGRLYRVRYKDTPRATGFDLSKESDEQLIERLNSGNDFIRGTARRILVERSQSPDQLNQDTVKKLIAIAEGKDNSFKQRIECLWTLFSSNPKAGGANQFSDVLYDRFLGHEDAIIRAWAVRAVGDRGGASDETRAKVVALAKDASPDVKLQVAIAARKIKGLEPLPLLVSVLANAGDDKLIPHIVWQNLHPLLETRSDDFLAEVKKYDLKQTPTLAKIMPRVTERILAAKKPK